MSARFREHQARVNKAIIAYYGMEDPIMSDAEFDELFMAVYGSDKEPFEVYQRLFAKDGRKRKLQQPMLSLTKARTPKEVQRWVDKVKDYDDSAQLFMAPKYDGLACLIHIRNGEVESAITRGDGTQGEDVTYAVSNIPVSEDFFPEDGLYSVEVCMSAESMAALNEKHCKGYAHPRNAAVGVLRAVGSEVRECVQYLSLHKHFARLTEVELTGDISQEMSNYRDSFLAEMASSGESILTDGVVLFACDSQGNVLRGMGDDGAKPRYAIAWKFPNTAQIATVQSVVWQQGRTKNTPVALFAPPVDFDGVLVSRASLHNQDIIESLGLYIGDQVELVRSNEVIPYIKSVHRRGEDRKPIPPAPEVEMNTRLQVAHTMKVLDVRGAGPQTVSDIADYLDKAAEPREYISEFVVRGLVDMCNKGPEAFQEAVTSFGPKSSKDFADTLHAAMQRATMVEWFAVVGIPGIGRRVITQLMNKIGGGSKGILEHIDAAQLTDIPGFGKGRVTALEENYGALFAMDSVVRKYVNPDARYNNSCPDDYAVTPVSEADAEPRKIVVTGKIEGMTRAQIAAAVEDLGCTLEGSVTKATAVLFDAAGKPSSKVKNAQKHGVPIVSVSSFEDISAWLVDNH